MKIDWKVHDKYLEVGTIPTMIGDRIVAEISNFSEQAKLQAHLYHTMFAGDEFNKTKMDVNREDLKSWCQKEIDGW